MPAKKKSTKTKKTAKATKARKPSRAKSTRRPASAPVMSSSATMSSSDFHGENPWFKILLGVLVLSLLALGLAMMAQNQYFAY